MIFYIKIEVTFGLDRYGVAKRGASEVLEIFSFLT